MESGIYMIWCANNGDRYIGSSVNLKKRKYGHWFNLRHNKHHNSHMQNVWNKHGEKSFRYTVLEKCDVNNLIMVEQRWIDALSPELNKAQTADSGFLGLSHTEETKKSLSSLQKSRMKSRELRLHLSKKTKQYLETHEHPSTGRVLSESQKKTLRAKAKKQFASFDARNAHSSATKKGMTKEVCEKISAAKKGAPQPKWAIEKRRKSLSRVWKNYSNKEKAKRVEKTAEAVRRARSKTYEGFVSPFGKEYRDVYNLSEFCRKHNLLISKMCLVNSCKQKSHKGWTRI